MKFYLLLLIRHHSRHLGELTLVRILSLCGVCRFSQDPVRRLQSEGLFQGVSSWSLETVKEEKINFPSILNGECFAVTPLSLGHLSKCLSKMVKSFFLWPL